MRCLARDNDIFYAAYRLPVELIFLLLTNSLYHHVPSNMSRTHLINRRRRLQRFKVNRFSNHTNKKCTQLVFVLTVCSKVYKNWRSN